MQRFRRKEIMSMIIISVSFFLLVPFVDSSPAHSKSTPSHRAIQYNPPKLNPKLSFQIKLHALLLWASIGFLMPVGILIIRMSNRVECVKRLKVLFYTHVILQIAAVLLALAAATLSIMNFENFFNNTHQRIGLALYGLILIQPLIGFFRPQRGVKVRSTWYFVHWLLGTGICILGAINIYIGLHAFHVKTSSNVRLWTILFTAEICIIAFIYLLQDRWEYMQKQGVILGNEQIRPTDEPSPSNQNQKDATVIPSMRNSVP